MAPSEAGRLEALYEFSILDTLPEQSFDDITQIASLICDTPIAQISFIDAERQWIKSSVGMDAHVSPRASSFCAQTILTKSTLVVEDASRDSRFQDNPFVTGEPHIRCYAGAPIVDPEGNVFGTVCVIDTRPHTLCERQVSALQALARQVMALLEQRKLVLEREKSYSHILRSRDETLKTTTARLQRAQAAGKMASWEWILSRNEFIWGGGCEWVFGRPASELATFEQIVPLIHPEDKDAVLAKAQSAIQAASDYAVDFRILWPDGSVHWCQSFGQPFLTVSGKVERIAGINMDITERKNAEETMIRNEKLAAVGRLASTIAHEINNPLATVTNLLYLAGSGESMEEVKGYLSIADNEMRRISLITNQTLRFHRQTARPAAVFCEEMVDGLLILQRSRIQKAHVVVETRWRAKRPVVCYEGEIRQVLSNLILNAIDAIPAGGKVFLRSREGCNWKTGVSGVIVTVADTGTGIDPSTLARIFDAFFSTKGNAGTGLGLWISREILEKHQGYLHVRSTQREGRSGTVFTLFLPQE